MASASSNTAATKPGWQDKLAIHVWVGGLNRTVFLDEDGSDFEKPVDALLDEIVLAVQSAG
jgi:hypothetical protein